MVWFRDRFFGADTQAVGVAAAPRVYGAEKRQRVDCLGWEGRFGPVRGLLQGNLMVGTAEGGRACRPGPAGADYDIFAGSAIGYVEVDLGVVRPFRWASMAPPMGTRATGSCAALRCSPRTTRRNGPRGCWPTWIRLWRRGRGTLRVRRGSAGCGHGEWGAGPYAIGTGHGGGGPCFFGVLP